MSASDLAASAKTPPGRPPLTEVLRELLAAVDFSTDELDSRLTEIERAYGEPVHAALIDELVHLRFETLEAREHWQRVLDHRQSMRQMLGGPVDLRLALLSHFLQIDRSLSNPRIIEAKLFDRALASAYVDELTGLRNYRYFRECLPQEVLRSAQYGAPLTLAMIDVDDFKHYNDRNGHPAGNTVLSTVAGLVSAAIRRVDIAARFGGEEFALVLPSTPKEGAELVAERLRGAVESHPFEHGQSQPGKRLTISLGIATYPADAADGDGLLRCADEALYVAKAQGKNRVELYAGSTRSYPRIRVQIEGMCRVPGKQPFPARISEIGAGGMRFAVDSNVPIGTLIETAVSLPGAEQQLTLSGHVLRVDRDRKGRLEAALRFVDISAADRSRLVRLSLASSG